MVDCTCYNSAKCMSLGITLRLLGAHESNTKAADRIRSQLCLGYSLGSTGGLALYTSSLSVLSQLFSDRLGLRFCFVHSLHRRMPSAVAERSLGFYCFNLLAFLSLGCKFLQQVFEFAWVAKEAAFSLEAHCNVLYSSEQSSIDWAAL